MTFLWTNRHFSSIEELEAYLREIGKPSWCLGVTIHHTLIPTIAQWRGLSTMKGMARHYEEVLGWDRGPNLFIAPDGFWEGTPLTTRGIHAGQCNSNRLGIEIVGNYDLNHWQEPMRSRVWEALIAIHRIWRIDPNLLRGHRECLPNKSCPGSAINLDIVRRDLKTKLSTTVVEREISVAAGARVRSQPSTKSSILRTLPYKTKVRIDAIVDGEYYSGSSKWARLIDGGYIWEGLL